MNENALSGVKAAIFDLDGTVYIGGELIGDAANTLKYLKRKGIKVGFLTNNSSRTDEEYENMLAKLGVYETGDFLCSSLSATVEYLNKTRRNAKIYALATNKVDAYLRKTGLDFISENRSDEADTVLLAFDKEINYKKLERANRLLVGGAAYIATHPDNVCPEKDGAVPDVGSFIELFYATSGRRPDVIIGKPYPVMAQILARRLGLKPEEMLMVGDRLYTDIAFGLNSGLKTALVFSGETTEELYAKSDVRATIAIKDVNELPEFL